MLGITHTRLPGDMIVSMAWIKKACARANRVTGALSSRVAEAIERACDELIDGKLHDQFIVDPIQGGAGIVYLNQLVSAHRGPASSFI